MSTIKLTEYSRSAGCGCKIAPQVLEEILQTDYVETKNERLIIGNNTNDDAAVYKINEEQYLISTTDFFMPIVDDPFTFGKIAAANAISDVYAMGGSPILALAILGWPVEKLPATAAQEVIKGAKHICKEAGISLAGGHSIDSSEPIFGLSVNGVVAPQNLKTNSGAQEGDYLFLTKSIGIGVLATAFKRGLINEEHQSSLIDNLTSINDIGAQFGTLPYVHAMTDVTGFGLVGHLLEMCKSTNLGAEIYFDKIKILDGVKEYLNQNVVPDATYRNWNAYSNDIKMESNIDVMTAFKLLPDPQTNGGLWISVSENHKEDMIQFLNQNNLDNFIEPIGRFTEVKEKRILIK